MSKAPAYQEQTIRFRGEASSGKFNEHTQQTFYDLVNLFNLANDQEKEIEELRDFFEVNAYFSQSNLDKLKQEVDSLRRQLEESQSAGREYKLFIPASSMNIDTEANPYENATIDKSHNLVTLQPSHQESKLYLYDDINDEYIVPNTLLCEVAPAADGVMITENDVLNALTPDNSLFWHRKYNYTTQDHAKAEIVITLPDNIISSRNVNAVHIHPFPLGAIDIENVEYKMSGGWKPLPGFEAIEEAGNIKLHFGPTAMAKIRITLKQRSFIERGGRRIFHIGLRDVGVSYEDYQASIGRFSMNVDLNPHFQKKQLIGITPIYQNESTLDPNTRLMTLKAYGVDATGKTTYLNDRFPIAVEQNKLHLKGVLMFDRNNKSTPALAGIELTFKGDS